MESQLRSALKHTISIDFSIYNLQEPTSKFANQASAHPSFSGYTSLHSLHRSASARSALKHTISIDFSIFNLQEQTSKFANQASAHDCFYYFQK